jgi:hypothetical protein
MVNPETVVFAEASPVRWRLKDVDGDGDKDLLFHFKTQELELGRDSGKATLSGSTYSRKHFSGTDTVKIVPRRK